MADSTGTGTPPPKRHWNGEVGARHEHQNVWMNGGIRSPAGAAPWAGWDADRKRRASEASTKSNISSSSNSNNSRLFNKLHTQKRESMTDLNAAERRKSFADMLPEKGFFSKMWHRYTSGNDEWSKEIN